LSQEWDNKERRGEGLVWGRRRRVKNGMEGKERERGKIRGRQKGEGEEELTFLRFSNAVMHLGRELGEKIAPSS
jgi:hypothetical protein